jgi:hypothetical protein
MNKNVLNSKQLIVLELIVAVIRSGNTVNDKQLESIKEMADEILELKPNENINNNINSNS